MKQITKTGVLLLVLVASQVLSVNAQGISGKLKETGKKTVTVYEHLIQFVLTKDTLYHIKAMKTIDEQEAEYKDLQRKVESGSIYQTLISADITVCGAFRTLYDNYFRNQILSNIDKTKDFKYLDQTFSISGFQKKKFDELLKELKKEQKTYSK